jgi:hypothetical protein
MWMLLRKYFRSPPIFWNFASYSEFSYLLANLASLIMTTTTIAGKTVTANGLGLIGTFAYTSLELVADHCRTYAT